MQSEEQRLIDGLFSRLKEAEAHSASRDASAEERIAQHVSAQPAAPYYMAQTILIQKPRLNSLTIASVRWRVRSANCRRQSPAAAASSPACLAVAARHAVLTLSRARSNMVARRPALSRSIRHHRSRTMPRRLPHAAAALWRARCKRPLAWQAAWCWAIC